MKKESKYMHFQKKMIEKIENSSSRWELVTIIIFSLLLVFGVTWIMGTMTCGFHLVDDHDFLKWTYEIKNNNANIINMIFNKIKADLLTRYEPLYYPGRILGSYIWGINITAFFVLKAFEISISIIFLYYCGKLMGANKIYSLLFSLISMIGYQSAVWWKLGPQEAQCTMLFSMGLFCMLQWLKSDKKKWAAISLILFFLMCNYKESFILLIPFLMLYVLYDEINKKEGKLTFIQIKESIQKRFWYLLVLGGMFAALVLFIVFFVGVNNYDKVGLDATVPWRVYKDAFIQAIQTDLKWFYRFGILFGLILLTYWDELKKLWKEMLLILTFLLPQFIIFGQSGITERYILPSSIGFACFFVIIIPKWKPLSGRRRVVYILGLLLLLAAHSRVMLREADYFRYRGNSVTTMLESVKTMSNGSAKVLSCLRPNEEGNLTMDYWMKVHGFDNIYFWTEEEQLINKICDRNLHYADDLYLPQNYEEMDIVVMYNKEDRHWCYTPSLDLSDFTEVPCGTLTIYVRNGVGIEAVVPEIEELKIHF